MNIFSGICSVFCWQIGAWGALLAKRNVHTNHLDPKRSARKRARCCQMNSVNTYKYKTNTTYLWICLSGWKEVMIALSYQSKHQSCIFTQIRNLFVPASFLWHKFLDHVMLGRKTNSSVISQSESLYWGAISHPGGSRLNQLLINFAPRQLVATQADYLATRRQ